MAEPRLLTLRTAVVMALGLVLAAASALAAYGMVHEKRGVADASAGSLVSGFALAQGAMDVMAQGASEADGASLSLSPELASEVCSLSHSALLREPLNAEALRNLAILELSAGEAGRSQQLLLLAEKLTRRDRRTNVLLVESSAKAGDLAGTIARLDQTLRTSTRARQEMMPQLYQVLAQPGALDIVAAMLGANVNWESDFWASAATSNVALEELAGLRIRRAEAGFAGTLRDDQRLLDALVKSQSFVSAEALGEALFPQSSEATVAVRNGDFTRKPIAGAFDWELRFDEALTTDILPSRGQLRIRTFSNGGGLVARQLISLPNADYRLALRASQLGTAGAGSPRIELTCAERQSGGLQIPLTAPRMAMKITKPDADCRYFWLDVIVPPQADRRENTVVLESIALTPDPQEAR